MVSAEDVIHIYKRLSRNGIQVWLTGGWGIDALLQKQTRPHKDLDIVMLVDDVDRTRNLLNRDGYRLKELWSENSWVMDAHGAEVPTAFVMQDSDGHEVDIHAMHLDHHGNGIPAWADEGLVFKREDLAGEGMIVGCAVRCISADMQVLCHTGYDLPCVQIRDLEFLHKEFGVKYPNMPKLI
jgi:lincosamide nucleotidyltransferase A/C/D/E